MADQQPQLLALPSRYANLEQPEQVPEELSVQFHLLPLRSLAMSKRSRTMLSGGFMTRCSSLLFVDSRSYAIKESEEEGKVDGSRDLGAVFEVERRELGYYALQSPIRRDNPQLRLRCHYPEFRGAVYSSGNWIAESLWGSRHLLPRCGVVREPHGSLISGSRVGSATMAQIQMLNRSSVLLTSLSLLCVCWRSCVVEDESPSAHAIPMWSGVSRENTFRIGRQLATC